MERGGQGSGGDNQLFSLSSFQLQNLDFRRGADVDKSNPCFYLNMASKTFLWLL